MNNFARTLLVISTGLITAQIIATLQVFLSNAELLHKVTILSEQGYLTVPGKHNMHALAELAPAFIGGLFITLTAGASISILSLAGFLSWKRYERQRRILLFSYLLVLVAILSLINQNGLNILASSYFVLVPAIVSVSALQLLPPQLNKQSQPPLLPVIITILILAPLLGRFTDTGFFLEIRDRILMSNDIGAGINAIYYRYSLYPAEVIKTLDQKTLKTVNIDKIEDPALTRRIQRVLLDRNYLVVDNDKRYDLEINNDNGVLLFSNRGKVLVRTTIDQFNSAPDKILSEFSDRSDKNAFFRGFISYSLVWAVPLIVFIVLYCLFWLIFNIFFKAQTAYLLASACCLVIGIAFLVSTKLDSDNNMDLKKIQSVLEKGDSSDRIRALKIAAEKGIDISNFSGHINILHSPNPTVRYWLLRALANGHEHEVSKTIIPFIDDPNLNVACMAYYAVGKSGDSNLINTVIEGIDRTDHWYVQLYAYQALMDLGWRQSRASDD